MSGSLASSAAGACSGRTNYVSSLVCVTCGDGSESVGRTVNMADFVSL